MQGQFREGYEEEWGILIKIQGTAFLGCLPPLPHGAQSLRLVRCTQNADSPNQFLPNSLFEWHPLYTASVKSIVPGPFPGRALHSSLPLPREDRKGRQRKARTS